MNGDRTFYNPYHFVPLEAASDPKKAGRTSADAFRKDGPATGDGHDAYCEDRLSGRLVCRLTTVTPLVIGAKQHTRPKVQREVDGKQVEMDDFARVEPYLFGGLPAIPATSLKGMLSSVAEASSGSAMRVLHNQKPVSFRQPMNRALSAMGRLEFVGSKLWLRPLVVPTLLRTNRRIETQDRKAAMWARVFKTYANLKVYLSRWSDAVDSAPSYMMSAWEGGPWELLGQAATRPTHSRVNNRTGHVSVFAFRGTGRPTLIGANDRPGEGQVRGYVRVLGSDVRDMPAQKKHELFIPCPEGIEKRSKLLPVSQAAIDEFNWLARERAEENGNNRKDPRVRDSKPLPPQERKPYLPLGTHADEANEWTIPPTGGPIVPRLREGHIVYFDVEEDTAGQIAVSRISFSAIWRGCARIEGVVAGLYDFIKAQDADLLPYHGDRLSLTPAERLFGFVSNSPESDPNTQGKKSHVALAGRVRPSVGILVGSAEDAFLPAERIEAGGALSNAAKQLDGWTRLRTLASPKPPSPTLYFRHPRGEGTAIAKEQLNVECHRVQGRKVYLHQEFDPGQPDSVPWRTGEPYATDAQAKLKNAVQPVKADRTFWFHLDFDNLTEDELDLLCFAVRPCEGFLHKLGMGKPIGLGSVRIDPVGMFLVDRKARYASDGPSRPRYHRAVQEDDGTNWPDWYRCERDTEPSGLQSMNGPTSRANRYRQYAERVWPNAIHALLLLGKTMIKSGEGSSVHTPLLADQWKSPEDRTFEWFADNQERLRRANELQPEVRAQQLKPIGKSQSMPALHSRTRLPPRGR